LIQIKYKNKIISHQNNPQFSGHLLDPWCCNEHVTGSKKVPPATGWSNACARAPILFKSAARNVRHWEPTTIRVPVDKHWLSAEQKPTTRHKIAINNGCVARARSMVKYHCGTAHCQCIETHKRLSFIQTFNLRVILMGTIWLSSGQIETLTLHVLMR